MMRRMTSSLTMTLTCQSPSWRRLAPPLPLLNTRRVSPSPRTLNPGVLPSLPPSPPHVRPARRPQGEKPKRSPRTSNTAALPNNSTRHFPRTVGIRFHQLRKPNRQPCPAGKQAGGQTKPSQSRTRSLTTTGVTRISCSSLMRASQAFDNVSNVPCALLFCCCCCCSSSYYFCFNKTKKQRFLSCVLFTEVDGGASV